MPETTNPHAVPGWMQSRPQEINTVKVFINDDLGLYLEGTFISVSTRIEAHDQADLTATPKHAQIRLSFENWVAENFRSYKRPNLKLRRFLMMNNPLPSQKKIYIMMLNGDIYSSVMIYESTVPANEPFYHVPANGVPLAHQPVDDGIIVGTPIYGSTVVGVPAVYARNAHV